MRKIWIVPILILVTSCFFEPRVVMVTYNVQNLFDDSYQGTEYNEFATISQELYMQKISNLAGGFERIRQKYGKPAVVLLQEVENSAVVHELVASTKSLQGMHIIFAKEPTHATGLAILSRYQVLETMTIQVRDPLDDKEVLRPILIAVIELSNNQVVAIANVHLQSQLQEKNVHRRSATLDQLYLTIEAIRRKYNNISIILGGDFNTDLANKERMPASIISIEDNIEQLRFGSFYNAWVSYQLWAKERDYLTGSYAYQGNWQALDGFLVDYSLLLKSGLTFDRQEPVSHNYFLDSYLDTENDEIQLYPKAFYKNRIDGVSDHLPVVALFRYTKLREGGE